MKFEEHCEPKGKILERICPQIEQCLSPSTTNDQSKLKKDFKEKLTGCILI
jgi:hypothetical protein